MSPTRRGTRVAGDMDADAGERRWRLEDERDFLQRSLADLAAERAAGDIEEADYEGLVSRDRRRLAAVESELAELEAALLASPAAPVADEARQGRAGTERDAERSEERGEGETETAEEAGTERTEVGDDRAATARPKRRRPRWLAVVAAVALGAGATLLVVNLASPRLPGQPETGSAAQNLAQRIVTQLNEATVLVNQGTASSLGQALTLYQAILVEDPNQPQALAELGYLEWEAGYARGDASLENRGAASVERSLAVERDDSAAHLFLGTIDLEQGHDPAAAVAQYRQFLAERPPAAQVATAAPLLRLAFTDAGLAVPAAVPAG